MGKIVIATNCTLDGVVRGPDGEEGFKRGGWWKQFVGKDLDAWFKLETEEALRRCCWAGCFGSRTPSRSGEYFELLNSLPKYVVSATLKDPVWKNSTVLKGDVKTEVSKLKQKMDGDILVYGSHQLGHALMEHDLTTWSTRYGWSSSRSCSAQASASSGRPAP